MSISDKIKALDNQISIVEEPLLHRPCVYLIIGGIGSGKSNLVANILNIPVKQGGYRKFFSKIFVISPSMKQEKGKFSKLVEETEREGNFYTSLNNNTLKDIMEKLEEFNDETDYKENSLLLLDDCLAELPKSQTHPKNALLHKIICNARHLNLSVWITSQKLKCINTITRCNAQMVSMFSAVPKEREDFCTEYGVDPRVYQYCTQEPYSFCHLVMNKGGIPVIYKKFDRLSLSDSKDESDDDEL